MKMRLRLSRLIDRLTKNKLMKNNGSVIRLTQAMYYNRVQVEG